LDGKTKRLEKAGRGESIGRQRKKIAAGHGASSFSFFSSTSSPTSFSLALPTPPTHCGADVLLLAARTTGGAVVVKREQRREVSEKQARRTERPFQLCFFFKW
jgi:hypothetical protein